MNIVRNTPLTLILAFSALGLSDTLGVSFSDQEQQLFKKADEDERAVFMKPGAHDDKKLDSAMIESGARLDPASARGAMLEFTTPEKLLGNLTEARLTTSTLKTPKVFKDVNAFLASATFTKFRALSDEKGAPPYQKIYPQATADLLRAMRPHMARYGAIVDLAFDCAEDQQARAGRPEA